MPNLGVTLAGLAVIVDLILLLLYLDRFVHALRPVAVAPPWPARGWRSSGDGAAGASLARHAADDLAARADLQVRVAGRAERSRRSTSRR